MKTKHLSVILASVLSVANAEKSGVFAGLEVGVNIATHKSENVYNVGYDTTTTMTKYLLGGTYGLLVGYKQFFNSHIGLRYYANFNYKHGNSFGDFLPYIHTLNYGANIDFLGNFVSSEDLDFGGFVGLGIGGNTTITNPKNANNLDVGLNVGLRTTFDSKQSLELVARVSFLPINLPKDTIRDSYEYSYYSVALRYTYNF